MTAITLREKTAHKVLRAAVYAVLPCLVLITAVIPFAAYNAQELGNLVIVYSWGITNRYTVLKRKPEKRWQRSLFQR